MTSNSETVSLIATGDMMFDTRLRPPRVFYYLPETTSCVPRYQHMFPATFLHMDESFQWLQAQGISTDGIRKTAHASQSKELPLPAAAAAPEFPFQQIQSTLLESDIVFGNLECPLSLRGRPTRNDLCYRATPEFAAALAASNFKVISFSNNHCMDYEEVAFLDTLQALRENGIEVVGAGENYEAASRAALIEIGGVRLAFLAYNLVGPEITYALPDESGVIPPNEITIKSTVEQIKSKADVIFASVHWGVEGIAKPTSEMAQLAHLLIDTGVDVVLGHHQHLVGSIEIYKTKPIFYSLGNFIFGHTHANWVDNMMVKFVLDRHGVRQIELIPVGGVGLEQFQPTLISGKRAVDVLQFVSMISASFGTTINVLDGRGLVEMEMAVGV